MNLAKPVAFLFLFHYFEIMELFEVINCRRSIRSYQDRKVSDDVVEKVLAAAMMAPSAADSRPWEFVVIDDNGLKEEISHIHPYIKMIKQAPLGVLVCANLKKEKVPGYWPQDCSAAIQNLLLAAYGCGLGAVWTGVHPVQERVDQFRQLLNLEILSNVVD